MPHTSTAVISVVTLLACLATGHRCQAATDCDVMVLKATSVAIQEDKIIIKAEANIRMVIITPDGAANGQTGRFTGRSSLWIEIKADEATFVVVREGKGEPRRDEFWKMSVDAAQALQAGEEIDRLGFYRPDITIKKNRVHEITGYGYVIPKRASDDRSGAAWRASGGSSSARTAQAP